MLFGMIGLRGDDTSDWSPAKADLLFMSNRDGNAEIYLVRAGQKDWTNLTNHKGGDNWPSWSPDGQRIVFQSNRAGNLDVWTMNVDGSNPVQLTNDKEPDYLPSWSPDGKTIIFTSWRKETAEAPRAPHVYVMNADGTGQRRLPMESLNTSAGASYSPDGKWIVYTRKNKDNGADIFVADREGKNERQLTDDKSVYNGADSFSPDGQWISFYADDGKGSAIKIIKADGSERRTIVAQGKNWYPRWSPDGRWLAYCAPVNGNNIDILAVPVVGERAPMILISSDKREAEGSWRPR
jgi:TolB protein